jgi:hypothetical protein
MEVIQAGSGKELAIMKRPVRSSRYYLFAPLSREAISS